MDSIPEISIGLPVHNGERYVALAIESVLNQKFTDFELIISDNASTDSTWSICCDYAARDDRIRLHRNAGNVGALQNFLLVYRHAGGKYFMWMAHDDILDASLLTACYDFLKTRYDYVLCCPTTVIIDERGLELREVKGCRSVECDQPRSRYAKCLGDMELCHAWYGLIRRQVIQQIEKYFYLPSDANIDHRLVCAIALSGKIKRLDEARRYYRTHANQAYNPVDDLVRYWNNLGGPTAEVPLMPWKNYCSNHFRQILSSHLTIVEKLELIGLVLKQLNVTHLKKDIVHLGAATSVGRPRLGRLLKTFWHAVRVKDRSGPD
jgi:glycosyltransferase involved in cell wall biosynthesis